MKHRQFCFTLDLEDDKQLIRQYERYHQPGNVFPEVVKSIKDSGIIDMKIYRFETRLIMLMIVDDSFTFANKAQIDQNNPKIQEWEQLMDRFQKRVSSASNEKWVLCNEIFTFADH